MSYCPPECSLTICTAVAVLQNCTESPAEMYGNIIKSKVDDADNVQAVGYIVYTAQAILQKVGCWAGWT